MAGAWCWIKATDDECHEIKAGVIEQFALWYGPLMLCVFFFFLVTGIIIFALFMKRKKAATEQHMQDQFSRSLKEMRPLLFYPIIFGAIYSLGFANRVYYAATRKAVLGLWISHAVIGPTLPLMISLAFFLHPKIRKRLNCHEFWKALNSWRFPREETYFSVSNEDEELERLVIRGQQINSAGVSSFLDFPN